MLVSAIVVLSAVLLFVTAGTIYRLFFLGTSKTVFPFRSEKFAQLLPNVRW
jgi:hypothetical protein